MKFTAEVEATDNGGNQTDSILTPKWPSARRSKSLSSSSSFSSNSSSSFKSLFNEDSPPPSPATVHLRCPGGGIPFSWETTPGIPRTQILKKMDSSRKHHNCLPLPPASAPVCANAGFSGGQKKHLAHRRDPFFVALVECSKGDDGGGDKTAFGIGSVWKGAKLGWSLSERFGFVNPMSCKSSFDVAESLVFLPRVPRRIRYDVVKKRGG